ncbi:hypothetical protein WMY93_021738 [Mugilogobius chulae]|uniref:Starch-binding domain-containing protein 1 n=1 Tax=Mugilogobius chulae TaxID=88201 RepID=A0AAW0NIN8_9GOBI
MSSFLEDVSDESLVTNEDSFGSEIEDNYQKAMEDTMWEIVDHINTIEKKVDERKKVQEACVSREEVEKTDSEKTEISIMEATMDHNEWIIDDIAEFFNRRRHRHGKKVLAVQPMPQNVNVTFRVHYLPLTPHQTVAVTGDQPELGAWKSVVPLEKTKDGFWSCVVGLPVESHVEWKFVVMEEGEVCRWEECGNRLLHTGFGDDLLVHKWWGCL